MIKYLFGLLLVAVVAVSCLKSKEDSSCPYRNVTITAPTSEQDSVKAYLDSNGVHDAVQHPSGFYYKILNPGAGSDTMDLCSQILISYKGTLKNGTVFDQQNNVIFVLGSLIEGWKKGIPLLKKGGSIKLYIPPSLGYGGTDVRDNNSGQVVIPANSMLIFDVTLTDYSVPN
jgi:FKBP-type peptidyl-prolyl cis-trans isomerase FkpA